MLRTIDGSWLERKTQADVTSVQGSLNQVLIYHDYDSDSLIKAHALQL